MGKSPSLFMKVLLLDDNRELREFLISVLTESGVEVVAVSSAEDALAQFRKEGFRGFVVDSTIEETDGLTLVDEVRALPLGKDVPVLLMSEIDTALARRIVENAHCEFIAKPFGMTEFIDRVRALR